VTTEQRIRTFIRDDLNKGKDVGELADDYPLIENQVIDSLGIFETVQFLEREFGTSIEDEDLLLDNFGTIADIARLVESKNAT
jgi:acyl carrier protein